MRDPNPLIFNSIPKPIPTTAKDLGVQLAQDSADKQASIFVQWQADIASWGKDGCWAQQCRMIAEKMTDDECLNVAVMLGTLVEHLSAIPQERMQQPA